MISLLLAATLKWGPYMVSWKKYDFGDMPEETPTLTISKGGKILRSFEVWNADAKTLDVDGDGTAELLVTDYSGGAHCCFTYYLYTRKPGLKLLGVFDMESGSLEFRDLDGDGNLEAVGAYDGFAYYDYPYAVSPWIPIVFSLKSGRYVENTEAFRDLIRERLDEYYLASPPESDEESRKSWVVGVYAHMCLLGEETSAWETVRRTCPDMLDWLSENKSDIKATLAAMRDRVRYTEEASWEEE
ncbi:MAG: VCBS repeat-containing protein [candidate division WOR-3 bacterium]